MESHYPRFSDTMLSLLVATASLTLPSGLHVASPPSGAIAHSSATRMSPVRMDDIPQAKAQSNVVESNRPDFACSFEIPKKGIAECA